MIFEMAQTEIEKLRLLTGKKLPDEQIADQARWCFEEGFDRKTVMVKLTNDLQASRVIPFHIKKSCGQPAFLELKTLNLSLMAYGKKDELNR